MAQPEHLTTLHVILEQFQTLTKDFWSLSSK